MSTPFDAVILGAAGYGGGELLRLLMAHPHLASLQALSRSHAGKPLYAAHPGLRGFLDQSFLGEMDWQSLAASPQPVVFSALAHGELANQLPELEAQWKAAGIEQRLVLVDLSGDFRIQDPNAFEQAYGRKHPCPERLPDFVYGCPEVHGAALRGARRIANPGCFATALNLALLPLAGLDITFVAASGATGSSGSGAHPQAGTHHPERAQDFRAYKVLNHQHRAEVDELMATHGLPNLHLAFVPHSAPLVRGIFATVQAEGNTHLTSRFADFYRHAPFVRMVEDSPRVAAVLGSNIAELAVHSDGRSTAILVALDNLVKGMAGQAIQNLNLALGLDERAGLWSPGRLP
ncbi:MAG: N-acetyl-gamma-glutamyl-phosphate reductase [Holophaga sp.]|nr:N-acetyl-gamma-glutamyl-phosphate reductase [Holophaga sp.]